MRNLGQHYRNTIRPSRLTNSIGLKSGCTYVGPKLCNRCTVDYNSLNYCIFHYSTRNKTRTYIRHTSSRSRSNGDRYCCARKRNGLQRRLGRKRLNFPMSVSGTDMTILLRHSSRDCRLSIFCNRR